eukprot:COSAG02_NODE_29856_length_561_cov_1.428571_1_plen_132_part_10
MELAQSSTTTTTKELVCLSVTDSLVYNSAGSWCGKGKFQWLDGRVYRGEFRDSAFNGHGKITYPDGTVRKGKWEEDDFVGSDSDDDDDDVADDDDDDVADDDDASENDSNPWRFSKGQGVADRGVAEGPQII